MKLFRWRLTVLTLLVLALGSSATRVNAADKAPVPSRRANPPDPASQAPVRLAQLDSHGRYPFGMYRGGYRYPFSYPYYRYYTSRQYPFGNGPYGPYGSNYGGYSGNAFDRGVYGRGDYGPGGLPDAPAPPPDRAAAPRPRVDGEIADSESVAVPVRPVPTTVPIYGELVPYSGGSPFNPSYGAAQLYSGYPFGYGLTNMWFGQNHLIQGFGYYPTQTYGYFYGPPSGMGFYGPEYMPSYYNYSVRNFGPYYPGIGGINGGAGMYQGW